MKFVHLSDLHLGKRVNEYSMLEDQEYILTKIINIIDDEKPAGVIIAGDVYDKSIPSAEAVQMFDDFLTRLAKRNLQVFVISAKHEEISQAIFDGINRGCTFVNVKTGYFHHNQLAVLCVLNNREYAKLNELVLDIDPTAFIISNEIHSVKGRGFTLPNIYLEKK